MFNIFKLKTVLLSSVTLHRFLPNQTSRNILVLSDAGKHLLNNIREKANLAVRHGKANDAEVALQKVEKELKKAMAKASAKKAGRPYPNLIDNMKAAKKRG